MSTCLDAPPASPHDCEWDVCYPDYENCELKPKPKPVKELWTPIPTWSFKIGGDSMEQTFIPDDIDDPWWFDKLAEMLKFFIKLSRTAPTVAERESAQVLFKRVTKVESKFKAERDAVAERAAAERAAAVERAADAAYDAAINAALVASDHIHELNAYLLESQTTEVRLPKDYADLVGKVRTAQDDIRKARAKFVPYVPLHPDIYPEWLTLLSELLTEYPHEQKQEPNTGGNSSAPAPTASVLTAAAAAAADADAAAAALAAADAADAAAAAAVAERAAAAA